MLIIKVLLIQLWKLKLLITLLIINLLCKRILKKMNQYLNKQLKKLQIKEIPKLTLQKGIL
jgi:hypothetical protein